MGLRPSEAAVLLAISNGIDTVDAIARALNASRETVRRIVEDLAARGLVEVRREGRIIRKEKLRLTRMGLDSLGEARRQLQELVEAYKHYRESRALPPTWRWGLDEFMLVLPLLAVLGIVAATELVDLLGSLGADDQAGLGYGEEEYEDIEDDWAVDDQVEEIE